VNVSQIPAKTMRKRQYDNYENYLTNLNPDVEKQKGCGHIVLWQASLQQRACESEAVQQPKQERYDPWVSDSDTVMTFVFTFQLDGKKQNAQSDNGLGR